MHISIPTELSGGIGSLRDFPRLDNIEDYFGIILDDESPGDLDQATFWNVCTDIASRIVKLRRPAVAYGTHITVASVEYRVDVLAGPHKRPLIQKELMWALQLIAQRRLNSENGRGYSGKFIDRSGGFTVSFAKFSFKRIQPGLTSSGNDTDVLSIGDVANTTLGESSNSTLGAINDWTWRDIPEVQIDSVLGFYTLVSLYAVIETGPLWYTGRWDYVNQEARVQWSYVPFPPNVPWGRSAMVEAVGHFRDYWARNPVGPMPKFVNAIADLASPNKNFKATIAFANLGLQSPDTNTASSQVS